MIGILKTFYKGGLESSELVVTVRDLTVLLLSSEESLLLAVDSDGGIGSKEMDVVQVENWETGYFAARVPLMEILSANARPLLVVDALTVEMEETGRQIITGIEKILTEAGMPDLPITGSTEENVPTKQTGIGVIVLGVISSKNWMIGSSHQDDLVAAAGIPKSGPEYKIKPDDKEILSLPDLRRLREFPDVYDVLPVGSKGIGFEVGELAGEAGLSFNCCKTNLDFEQSAGPSTCVIFTIKNRDSLNKIENQIKAPVKIIGKMK